MLRNSPILQRKINLTIMHVKETWSGDKSNRSNLGVMKIPKREQPQKWYMLNHVQLFATSRTIAHQAPLSMVFSRQDYWSGLPFPTPRTIMHVKETWAGNKSNRFNLGIVKMPKRESSYRSGNNKEIIGKKIHTSRTI